MIQSGSLYIKVEEEEKKEKNQWNRKIKVENIGKRRREERLIDKIQERLKKEKQGRDWSYIKSAKNEDGKEDRKKTEK